LKSTDRYAVSMQCEDETGPHQKLVQHQKAMCQYNIRWCPFGALLSHALEHYLLNVCVGFTLIIY